MHTLMRITPLALAALAGTALAVPPTPDDGADVQALANQLEQLKANYAQEVRRLRELDMQVQAMQARLGGGLAQPRPHLPRHWRRRRPPRFHRAARATPVPLPRPSRPGRSRGAAWTT